MKQKTKHIAKLVKNNISEIDPNAEVILYGSRVRGDERNDSDWDILVLTDYPVNNEDESKFRDHLYELEMETGEPFSIFVYYKQDWIEKLRITPFYENITREGVNI